MRHNPEGVGARRGRGPRPYGQHNGRNRMKKGLLGLLVLGGLLVAPSGALAQGGGFCALDGTANFTTPLGMTAKDFGYSFHGALSNCAGSDQGLSGTVTAGETFNGFPEPQPTGNGSCASSTTSGVSFVQWSDGKVTIVDYDTNGAAAAVALTGSVIPSYTLKKTNPDGSVSSLTVTTTRYAGGYAGGPLAFEPPDPTACNGAGVSTAGIQGLLGTGSPS